MTPFQLKLRELSQHASRLSASPHEPDAEALDKYARLVAEAEALRPARVQLPPAPAVVELATGSWADDWPDEG